MVKVYTKTGDQGETSLACGRRIPKDDLHIEAYGTIDELSSILGIVSAMLENADKPDQVARETQLAFLEWLQDQLFTLSGMIATLYVQSDKIPQVTMDDIEKLEQHIDAMENILPPLKYFIIPGGSELVSTIHLARTVCRRAERICISLQRETTLQPVIIPFLNRLSDDLFVFGRWMGHMRGEPEKIWLGRKFPELGDKGTRITRQSH